MSDLPSHPGQTYVKVWNPDAQVWAWRLHPHALLYRDPSGALHAFRPGESKDTDNHFRLFVLARGPLTLVGRKERRQMFRAEKVRAREYQGRVLYPHATVTIDGVEV